MEAEPASETSCFIKTLDDGQSPKYEYYYVSESCIIVRALYRGIVLYLFKSFQTGSGGYPPHNKKSTGGWSTGVKAAISRNND